MTQHSLLNTLGSKPPLRPETFTAIHDAIQRLSQSAESHDFLLEQAPLLEAVLGDDDADADAAPNEIIGRRWGNQPLSSLDTPEVVSILTYSPRGTELITTAMPDERDVYGNILGEIIFRNEGNQGHFNGAIRLFERHSIVFAAEWYLEAHAHKTNQSLKTFAGKLGILSVWKEYANNLENRGTALKGEFVVGQSVGRAMLKALLKLSSFE